MRGEPAGWYRDPDRPNRHRYWTGEQWSSWVGEELISQRTPDDGYDQPRERHELRWVSQRACG